MLETCIIDSLSTEEESERWSCFHKDSVLFTHFTANSLILASKSPPKLTALVWIGFLQSQWSDPHQTVAVGDRKLRSVQLPVLKIQVKTFFDTQHCCQLQSPRSLWGWVSAVYATTQTGTKPAITNQKSIALPLHQVSTPCKKKEIEKN